MTLATPGLALELGLDLVEVGQVGGRLAAAHRRDAEEADRGLGLGRHEYVPRVVADEGILDAAGGGIHEGVAHDEDHDSQGQEHPYDEALGLVLQKVPEGYADEYRHGLNSSPA